MTEYEMYDLMKSVQGVYSQDFGLMLSLLSCYLLVSYLAGKKLTGLQVSIISAQGDRRLLAAVRWRVLSQLILE